MTAHNKNYYDNGNIKSKWWEDDYGCRHKEYGPACIYYHVNGSIVSLYWYKNELIIRDNDLPPIIHYRLDGSIDEKLWVSFLSYKNLINKSERLFIKARMPMITNKAYKLRIYPTKEQAILLKQIGENHSTPADEIPLLSISHL